MFGGQPANPLTLASQQQPGLTFGITPSSNLGIAQQPQAPFGAFQQPQQPLQPGTGGIFGNTGLGLTQFPANPTQPAPGSSLFGLGGGFPLQQASFAPAPTFGQPQLPAPFAQAQTTQMLGPGTFGGLSVQQPFPAPVAPSFGFPAPDPSSYNWNNPQEMMQRLDQMQQALRRQELARQMSAILSYRNPYGDEVSTVLAELEAQRARDRAAASGLSSSDSVADSDLTRLIISQMRRDYNRPTSALEHMRVLRGDVGTRFPSANRHATSLSSYARLGPLNPPRHRPLSDTRPDDLDISYANSSFGGLAARAAGFEEERDWSIPRSTLRSTRPGNKSIDWEKRKARTLSANSSARAEQSSLYPSVRDERAESSGLSRGRRSFNEVGDTWMLSAAPARQRVRPNLVDAASGDDQPVAESPAAGYGASASRPSFEGRRSPTRERERSVDRGTDSADELENTGSTPTASSPLPVIVKGEPREVEVTRERSPAALGTISALSADSARSVSALGGGGDAEASARGNDFSEDVRALERELAALTHHRARIMCSRADYTTIPSLEQLEDMVDDNGDCWVENFTITRADYGQVRFLQRVNVAGLNLDKIGIYNR